MNHLKYILDRYQQYLRTEYPAEVFSIYRECKLKLGSYRGPRLHPDLQVVFAEEPTVVVCVVEIGHCSRLRFEK